ncbi:MAG: hypothetical protein ACUVSI_00145, partial [Actinomycetota bacterium]
APVKEGVVSLAKRTASATRKFCADKMLACQRVVSLAKRTASATVHAVRDVVYLPRVREYQGDIAVGALVIAVSLTLFLIMRLM